MKKTFDCVEMKRQIQEKLWIESGENLEGLKKLLNKRIKNNPLIQDFKERKAIAKQLESV